MSDAIAYFPCKDVQLCATVDNDGLKHPVNILDPRYETPQRAYKVKRDVVKSLSKT